MFGLLKDGYRFSRGVLTVSNLVIGSFFVALSVIIVPLFVIIGYYFSVVGRLFDSFIRDGPDGIDFADSELKEFLEFPSGRSEFTDSVAYRFLVFWKVGFVFVGYGFLFFWLLVGLPAIVFALFLLYFSSGFGTGVLIAVILFSILLSFMSVFSFTLAAFGLFFYHKSGDWKKLFTLSTLTHVLFNYDVLLVTVLLSVCTILFLALSVVLVTVTVGIYFFILPAIVFLFIHVHAYVVAHTLSRQFVVK